MAKTILIRGTIDGSDIVNFDSIYQRCLWNKQKDLEKINYNHDNVMFGKARYYIENDKVIRCPCISSNCIRHSMFEVEMQTHLPHIAMVDEKITNFAASPAALERGYLFARKGKSAIKRASPFALSHAESNPSKGQIEINTNSQPKNNKYHKNDTSSNDLDQNSEDDEIKEESENESESESESESKDDKSDNSLYSREVRGRLEYSFIGAINLMELAFISLSETYDRLSFPSDLTDQFKQKLSSRLGSSVSDASYYMKNHNLYDIPEFGILLDSNQVKFLCKDILTRLARFNLMRASTGSARMKNLEILVVNDSLIDTFDSTNGWQTILPPERNGFNFITNLNQIIDCIDVEQGYTLHTDQAKAKEIDSEYLINANIKAPKKPRKKST